MEAKDVKNVTVLGAGMIAPGVAQIFAAKPDYHVCIYARRQEALPQALDKIRSSMINMANRGVGSEADVEPAMSRIKTTTDFAAAVSDADMVIECIAEKLELKQKFFQDLDRLCRPDAILATNTSVISVSEIAANAKKRDRVLGTHFWNPPFLIPLVEVVKGNDTSLETVDTTYKVMQNAGKHPVKVLKDVPGFLANRLQHALWREAISIVENGIADAATVDEAVKHGFGLRLSVLGPMETADMAGLDLTLAIHDYIFKYLESSTKPSPILQEKVSKGELGFKTGAGFQEWDTQRIDEARKRLTDHLIEWTKKNKDNKH
ncbi:3-hydroxyacyl-CoA dehydrogenase family protein [Chloroflexota bacterium]